MEFRSDFHKKKVFSSRKSVKLEEEEEEEEEYDSVDESDEIVSGNVREFSERDLSGHSLEDLKGNQKASSDSAKNGDSVLSRLRKSTLSKNHSMPQILSYRTGGENSRIKKMVSPERMVKSLNMEVEIMRNELMQERKLNSKLSHENETLRKFVQEASQKFNHLEIVNQHALNQNKALHGKWGELRRKFKKQKVIQKQVVCDYRAAIERSNVLEEENMELQKVIDMKNNAPSPITPQFLGHQITRRHSDSFLHSQFNKKVIEKKMRDALNELSSDDDEEENETIPDEKLISSKYDIPSDESFDDQNTPYGSERKKRNMDSIERRSDEREENANFITPYGTGIEEHVLRERRKSEIRVTLVTFFRAIKDLRMDLYRLGEFWKTFVDVYSLCIDQKRKSLVEKIKMFGICSKKSNELYGTIMTKVVQDLGLEKLYRGEDRVLHPFKIGEVELKLKSSWWWKPVVMEISYKFCCISIFEKASEAVQKLRRKSIASVQSNSNIGSGYQKFRQRKSLAECMAIKTSFQKGKLIKRFFLSNIRLKNEQKRCLKISGEDGVILIRLKNVIELHEWTSFISNIVKLETRNSTSAGPPMTI